MKELLTVSRGDPKFESYLLGTFSQTERALPVQSLNVGSDSETVTFELVPLAEIIKPPFLKFWAQIVKLNSVLLVLLPVFLILIKTALDEIDYDAELAICGTLAALFFHVSVNLRNDFRDHMLGIDRIHPRSGSRAIQLGWITAAQAKKWSWYLFGFGVFFGLPSLFKFPELLFLLGIVMLLMMIGVNSFKAGLKFRSWTELAAFLLFGPLLTLGFQISIGAGIDLEAPILGILTGGYAVLLLHLKNIEMIMVNDRAKFENTMTRLGIDGSRRFLFLFWLTWGLLLSLYHFVYGQILWFGIFLICVGILSFKFWKISENLKTPVGSLFQKSLLDLRRLVDITVILWVVSMLIYLLSHEFQSKI